MGEIVMNESVIVAENLTKRFPSTEALHGMSFSVPQGSVYGLLGPNGAGKSTTIQIVMNLLRPSSGRVEVLGCPSQKLGWRHLQRVGYVSENQLLPEDMSGAQLLAYLRPFYPTWDAALCGELQNQLDIPMGRKLRHLSRGMKMKMALLASLAFRPELLVLDEPFGGLDPVVREDFTRGLLGTVADSHGAVLMSSQDVEEVERLCDWVGIMQPGRLLISEPLEPLLRRFRRVEISGPVAAGADTGWGADVVQAVPMGTGVSLIHQRFAGDATRRNLRARLAGVTAIDDFPMTLREIYLAVARARIN
jgi:ABC-2 type transport system ATP-binding protein